MNNNQGQSSSPGFLYFQTNTPQEELQQHTPNVPDFIAFSSQRDNGHYNQQEFVPTHFSSPQMSGRAGNFRQDRRRKQSPLWSRSPRRGGFRSFNSSQKFTSYNNSSNSQNSLQEHSDLDGSRFLHSSFTEDPWKKLESKLEQSMSSQSNLNQDSNFMR